MKCCCTSVLLTEIYSPGYNEENDLVCRMNRHGYSAVMANHAFIYHLEGASFGGRRKKLEQTNRAVLDARYPEYGRVVSEYLRIFMDPVDRFAALWGAASKTHPGGPLPPFLPNTPAHASLR